MIVLGCVVIRAVLPGAPSAMGATRLTAMESHEESRWIAYSGDLPAEKFSARRESRTSRQTSRANQKPPEQDAARFSVQNVVEPVVTLSLQRVGLMDFEPMVVGTATSAKAKEARMVATFPPDVKPRLTRPYGRAVEEFR